MTQRIQPNTLEGKQKEREALMRPARAETLLSEIDNDLVLIDALADVTLRGLFRRLCQRQRTLIRRMEG